MWITTIFSGLLAMSLTASAVIVCVIFLRLLLKKVPKVYSYLLWIVVLFRLLCPVSLSSDWSLLGLFPMPIKLAADTQGGQIGVTPVENLPVTAQIPGNYGTDSMHELTTAEPPVIVTYGWIAGIIVLLLYSSISLVKLRRQLIGAVHLRNNIYLSDYIGSPFVVGICKPKIFLPSTLSEREQGYIIQHEQHHICRFDPAFKLLAFLALCLHWFNPLVWLAFVLSGKDMEMSCDEAVMKTMDGDIRSEYSASLLCLTTGRKIISGAPLGFGEGDTKDRIKNVMNYRKPMIWVTIASAVIVVCAVGSLMLNPGEKSQITTEELQETPVVYVGNNSDVGKILSELSFPDDLNYNGFELDTAQPPYGITVNFLTDTEIKNFYIDASNQLSLEQNAAIMFSRISNVDIIHFNFDDGESPDSISFFRDSGNSIMEDATINSETNTDYKTEADFLNHPDGVQFQAAAYRAAKAYLNGDFEALAGYLTDNCVVDLKLDLFKDIDYMILKWGLDNIKSENHILASYEFLIKGEDSASYVSMELKKIDGEWKVDAIGLEK